VHYIGRWQEHSLKSAELHFATMVEPSKKPAVFSRRVERDTHYPSRSAAKIELQDLEWRENILAREQIACSAYSSGCLCVVRKSHQGAQVEWDSILQNHG
jgi:hypothetical protein